MAQVSGGNITIKEMRRATAGTGPGAFVPTGVSFTWTLDEKNKFHDSWAMPVKQRTKRWDLPGSEEPVEQVLGWNYEPQRVRGKWDDRYMGDGAAYATYQAFEAMVQRGSMVFVAWSRFTFFGIITDFVPDVKLPSLIFYDFTLSPHFKVTGQTVRNYVKQKALPTDPRAALDGVLADAQDLEVEHRDAGGILTDSHGLPLKTTQTLGSLRQAGDPLAFVDTDGVLETINDQLSDVFSAIYQAKATVNNMVRDPVGTIWGRVATHLGGAATAARTLALTLIGEPGTDTVLPAGASAVQILGYETWSRNVAARARLAHRNALDRAQDVQRRQLGNAKAIYTPQRGESVYAVSLRFYNTPHEWRRILERNGIQYMTFTGAETLIIPEIV